MPRLDVMRQPSWKNHHQTSLGLDVGGDLHTEALESIVRGMHAEPRHARVVKHQLASLPISDRHVIDARPKGPSVDVCHVKGAALGYIRPGIRHPSQPGRGLGRGECKVDAIIGLDGHEAILDPVENLEISGILAI